MCIITRRTYSDCGHKAKPQGTDRCDGFKQEGDDITCTRKYERTFQHQFIDGSCPVCKPETKAEVEWLEENLIGQEELLADLSRDQYGRKEY